MRIPLLLVTGALAMVGCSTQSIAPAANDDALRDVITARNSDLERYFEKGQIDRLAGVYTEDAVMGGHGGSRTQGRDAILAYWQRFEPISWKLDALDVERTGERDARQLGRSTLHARRNGGEEFTGVVMFELVWVLEDDGKWRIASDLYWSPNFDYAPAIQRVIDADTAAARVRNEATQSQPMHRVIRAYVAAMDAFDYTDAPGDFIEAMRQHRDAWADMIPQLERYRDERGEMHDVLDRLTAEGSPGRDEIQSLLDNVWATWGDVARAAARHGVEL